MKIILFIMPVVWIAAAIIFGQAGFVLLAVLFLTFAILEAFQTKREKNLELWKEEVEDKPNTIEEWHENE